MKILSIDTAVGGGAVGIVHEGRLVSYRSCTDTRENASRLIPMIEEAMTDAGISYSDLNLVAAGAGPGSFTGIRVGLAAARGIGLASEIQVSGVSNLDVFLALAPEYPALAAIDTKRGDFFIKKSGSKNDFTGEIEILTLEDLRQLAVTARVVCDISAEGFYVPQPKDTIQMLALLASLNLGAPVPVYVRPPEAKLPAGLRTTEGV